MRSTFNAAAVVYLCAGLAMASTWVRYDEVRCRTDVLPIAYVLVAAVWPLVGGLAAGNALFGVPVKSACQVDAAP